MRPFRLLLLCPLLLLLGIGSFLLNSCAQVAEISGGDRDTIPPRLISADPPHLTTNFKGDRITMLFSERIQLERVRERLLISPPLPTPPDVRLTGSRTVTIEINGPLKENTTYSFSVGEAVKDLTEGNTAAGLVHVISTGPHVDSLIIAGRVTNAFTGEPEKEVLVQVYELSDTATIRTGRPAYATRTNTIGQFALRYLRNGQYRLFALRDQNGNYRYDLPNEEIAFLDPAVHAEVGDTLLQRYELRLFKEHGAVQQVREAKVTQDGALQLLFNRPAEQVDVVDIARAGGSLVWSEEWGNTRDTVRLWPSDTTALQLGRYQINTEDGIIDTIRYRPMEPMPFFIKLHASLEERPEGPIIDVRTSRPIGAIDSSRFQLLRDSLPVPITIRQDPADERTLQIMAELEPGARATLRVLPRGVNDIYGGHNDTLDAGLGRAAERSTGVLRIRMEMHEGTKGPFLLRLINAQGGLLREDRLEVLDDEVIWERLSPGVAKLLLIEDRNNNGRWDPGILDEAVQPEQVWRNSESVNIRAGWDLGVDWIIGAPSEEKTP